MAPWATAFSGSIRSCADAFVDAAAALREREPLTPIVALAGSRLLLRQIRERLHRRAGGAWGVWLLTFHELAARLGEPALLATGRALVAPLHQRALAARLLRERPGRFAPIKDYDGAGAALLQTFNDLEEAGFARWPGAEAGRDKLADLAALFNAYRAELASRFYTPQDALAASSEHAAEFPRLFGANELHVVGIYDANVLQTRLLERLGAAIDVRFYLPEAVGEPTALMNRLLPSTAGGRGVGGEGDARGRSKQRPYTGDGRGAGGEGGSTNPHPGFADPLPPRAGSEGELGHPLPLDAGGVPLTILSAPSETAEAAEIIRRARALRRAGVAYHEMAVLLRHADPYVGLLAEMADRGGVPWRVAGGRAPREGGSLRALTRLLGLLGSTFGRGEVMSLLAAVDLPAEGADPQWRETQPQWDRVSRRARVRRGDDWDSFLQRRADGADGRERQAALCLRDAALALTSGLAKLSRAASFREAVSSLGALAARFINADAYFDAAIEKLREIEAADRAGLPFDLAFFRARALEAVAAVREGEDRAPADALLVADWHAARGLRFRAVFVPGCVESVVPKPPRQDPILLDRERAALAAAAGSPGALPTRADQAQEEIRLFHLTCAAASEQLVLSYPRLDLSNGRTRLPSHLLLGVASGRAGRALTYDEFAASPLVAPLPAGRFAPASMDAALDESERDLAAMAQAAKVDSAAPIRYLLGARPGEFGRVWARQTAHWSERALTPHEGWTETDAAIAALETALAAKDHWSVSEIEDYARCPRRYLYERLLGLESPEDPEAVVSLPPDQRGALLHKVLEDAADDASLAQPEQLAARLDRGYQTLAQENLTGGGALDQAERERLREWARAMLDFIAKRSAGCEPVAVEKRLDPVLDLGGVRVKLVSRLDRVERDAAGGLRIIDYKTGKTAGCFDRNKALRDEEYNGGCTLQLPLYLLAWLEKFGWRAGQEASAAYWHLKNAKGEVAPTAIEFTAKFARERLPELRDALRAMIEDVRRGRFAPRPDVAGAGGNAYCGRCGYTVICGARSRAQIAAKARQPGARPCKWLTTIGRIDGE